MAQVQKITLPIAGLDALLQEARYEGYDFLDVLADDWTNGINRFDGPGEVLCGTLEEDRLIAVGGLNQDPFLPGEPIGRIRRVYVRAGWRRQGVGELLIATLVAEARKTFHAVRLRAENATAARLYERMGFLPINDPEATHSLNLQP